MLLSLWTGWGEDWSLQHKVTFDGENKLIIIADSATSLNVKADIYSSWKEWVLLRDNGKFLPALRVTGGDPIGVGAYTGDVYFLINGWRIKISHSCAIDGVVYSDDYQTPFVQTEGTQIVTNKVSSLVSVVAPVVSVDGLVVPTAAENAAAAASMVWNSPDRTLTAYNGPTAAQIRSEIDASSVKLQQIKSLIDSLVVPSAVDIRNEIDTNSTKLNTVVANQTTILNAIQNVSVSSASINTPAISFELIHGVVTSGTIDSTRNINGSSHVITDSALAFDINYTFDIGLNSIPSEVVFVGQVQDKHEVIQVAAWNYQTNAWNQIGTISGSNTVTTNKFILYQQYTGTQAGQIGDVRIRFYSTAISDIILSVDQLYVSYATVERPTGYSGHAVTATATSIQLGADAVTLDNYYVPALLYVNHGTGAQQYAKVIGYNGATRTLQLELPMVVTLDTTSHITLSPWANGATVDTNAIANAVWTAPVSSMTDKTTIGGWITKMILTIPKYIGLK
jgi:hypothetical protein